VYGAFYSFREKMGKNNFSLPAKEKKKKQSFALYHYILLYTYYTQHTLRRGFLLLRKCIVSVWLKRHTLKKFFLVSSVTHFDLFLI